MRRKKTTHIRARDVQRAKKIRHRLACKRYRMRKKLGVRLNKVRVTDEELDMRAMGLVANYLYRTTVHSL